MRLDNALQWAAKPENCQVSPVSDKQKQTRSEYVKNRLKSDLGFKLLSRLRCRLNAALKMRAKKADRTVKLVGCTMDELRAHIEKQFEPGMSWDNWTKNGWHIDHKRPCCSFDLTQPEQQALCFHYSNLRPLWCDENWRKNGLWEGKRNWRDGKQGVTEAEKERRKSASELAWEQEIRHGYARTRMRKPVDWSALREQG